MVFYFFAVGWQHQSWQVPGSVGCKEGEGGLSIVVMARGKLLKTLMFAHVPDCIKIVLCVDLKWDYLCGNGCSFILRQY